MIKFLSISFLFILSAYIISSCDKIMPAELLVKPTTLNFGEVANSMNINVINTGDEKLDWRVDTNYFIQPWISYSPFSGSNEGNITVSVNRDTLAHGSYNGELHIFSNGGVAKVDIILIVFK
ncbi:MAG: hypothetical protein ABIJ97_17420 [Bacteroidota bacterium]